MRPTEEERVNDDETDRFLDEELIPALVVGGVLLVLFPEPVTSALGGVPVGLGVAVWLRDLFRGA